jgi:hypothetical protein
MKESSAFMLAISRARTAPTGSVVPQDRVPKGVETFTTAKGDEECRILVQSTDHRTGEPRAGSERDAVTVCGLHCVP